VYHTAPGSLDSWLTDRYCLSAVMTPATYTAAKSITIAGRCVALGRCGAFLVVLKSPNDADSARVIPSMVFTALTRFLH
jgi:hypothetical protein